MTSDSQGTFYSGSDGNNLRVPGFGLPVNLELESVNRFRHGAIDIDFDRMSVREVSMLRLIEALTDKPDWWRKVFNQTIIEKWRKEALEMPRITEKTWEWCLEELQDKAIEFEQTNLTTVLDMGSRCVKTDQLVPADLRDALISAVKPLLEHTPRDWHPGSNDLVLNLVHPSLYPAIYEQTRIVQHKRIELDDALAPQDECVLLPIPERKPPETAQEYMARMIASLEEQERTMQYVEEDPREREQDNRHCWSSKFQWLPCDVEFTGETDTSVKIVSYINNLHPDKHRPLYRTIETLISLSIPAWNQTLVNSPAGRTLMRITVDGAQTDPEEAPDLVENMDDSSEEDLPAIFAKINEYWQLPDNPENEPWFEEIEDDWQVYPSIGVGWKWRRLRKTIHPEPGVAPSPSFIEWKANSLQNDVSIQDTFNDTGLQVIVKLASIELTPEKPSYAGGNWHLEGMLNEHIVATAIYYFDVDNITESRIRFRQEAFLDGGKLAYEQGDHAPNCQLYGVDKLRDEPMLQELGSIATPNNRFLVFPNTLQHKVEPFSLADTTKPGHRRFLVLWLVDPHYRILSTGNIPPQQHEWWAEKANEKVQGKVSMEIQAMIEDQLRDGTMTLDEAKAYRLELMAERTSFTDNVQAAVREYDFCEH